jgi:hypothetical protein
MEKTDGKTELPNLTVSEALEAIEVVNSFYESRAGNSKIMSQIMDIKECSENRYGQATEDS